jgi:hypothetical protein
MGSQLEAAMTWLIVIVLHPLDFKSGSSKFIILNISAFVLDFLAR